MGSSEWEKLCAGGENFLTNPNEQMKVLSYFQQIRDSVDGWKICTEALVSGEAANDQLIFLCFQVVEDFLKKRYCKADVNDQYSMRNFLSRWLVLFTGATKPEAPFLRNKMAQIVSLTFVADFPTRWPTLIQDVFLNNLVSGGAKLVDLYLRTLLAIDAEVVDQEIPRTKQEIERNGLIKDKMRLTCIPDVIDSLYGIMSQCASDTKLVSLSLNVIGAYVSWIDITLIANDRFVPLIVRSITMTDSNGDLQEAAVDCLCSLLNKKIDHSQTKLQLIEAVDKYLGQQGVYTQMAQSDDEECELKLAELVDCVGEVLLELYTRCTKLAQTQIATESLTMAESKLPIVLSLLGNDDNDVSSAVISFVHEYLLVLKTLPRLSDTETQFVKDLLLVVLKKFRFPGDYNFEQEGETEAEFQEYRKEIKNLFTNIGMLSPTLTLETVERLVTKTLKEWATLQPEDIEFAINLLFSIGETVTQTNQDKAGVINGSAETDFKCLPIRRMAELMVKSGVSHCKHKSVSGIFLETVCRYGSFMASDRAMIQEILTAFLDDRGLRHQSATVRARAAYLFSRFVKTTKGSLQPYVQEILLQLSDLLAVQFGQAQLIQAEDQLFLFESVSYLIVSGDFDPTVKKQHMEQLLGSLWQKFSDGLRRYDELRSVVQSDQTILLQKSVVEYVNNIMAFASRTTKAFSTHSTMATCNCGDVFIRLMEMFLSALDKNRFELLNGVRQYLHRMVVCLSGPAFLPFVAQIVSRFLAVSAGDSKGLQEFLVLLQQIVSKYKKDGVSYLQIPIVPVYTTVFALLAQPCDLSDEVAVRDKVYLRRSLYQLVSSMASNDSLQLITSVGQEMCSKILVSVFEGAVDVSDYTSSKCCFGIFNKVMDSIRASGSVPDWFDQFVFKQVVHACFIAPTKPGFDFTDAQAVLVLNEIAVCLRKIFAYKGDLLVSYLTNELFPQSNLSADVAQEFSASLRSATEVKSFQKFLKNFFVKVLSAVQSSSVSYQNGR